MIAYAVRYVGDRYVTVAVFDQQAERMKDEGATYDDKRRAWAVARRLNRVAALKVEAEWGASCVDKPPTLRSLAKAYLIARWDDQCEKYPMMREEIPLARYVAVNLRAAMRMTSVKDKARGIE